MNTKREDVAAESGQSKKSILSDQISAKISFDVKSATESIKALRGMLSDEGLEVTRKVEMVLRRWLTNQMSVSIADRAESMVSTGLDAQRMNLLEHQLSQSIIWTDELESENDLVREQRNRLLTLHLKKAKVIKELKKYLRKFMPDMDEWSDLGERVQKSLDAHQAALDRLEDIDSLVESEITGHSDGSQN